jgi:hypothetical protein
MIGWYAEATEGPKVTTDGARPECVSVCVIDIIDRGEVNSSIVMIRCARGMQWRAIRNRVSSVDIEERIA